MVKKKRRKKKLQTNNNNRGRTISVPSPICPVSLIPLGYCTVLSLTRPKPLPVRCVLPLKSATKISAMKAMKMSIIISIVCSHLHVWAHIGSSSHIFSFPQVVTDIVLLE
ncbi:hypothetical protein GE21DRAFT_1308181 [Neurospora crassa]|nr:hypothetical protein B21J21.290 [imported] - Neurospora crassa [Neurospora crassa]KHE84916.1 hypothetical protein GE21DRAFT_1308181 [Neurospora crassa]